MTRTPCALTHTIRGEHLRRCTDTTCPGCLPALATPGLHVCTGHELAARTGIRDLPGLWADLGDTRRSAGLTDNSSGSGDPEGCPACDTGQPCQLRHRTGHEALSPARITARTDIRALLIRWCRTLQRDHGIRLPTLPSETIRWMAHHVAVHTGRILATDHAITLLGDLHGRDLPDGAGWHPGVLEHRRLLDTSRPAGVRVQCPACAGWVRLDGERETIRCPGTLPDGKPCPEWGTIEHWRKLVAGDADHPMNGPELVAWLARHHRYPVTEDVLRQWASRGTRFGKLTRCGEDPDGRTLYDPVRAAELVMLLRARRTG